MLPPGLSYLTVDSFIDAIAFPAFVISIEDEGILRYAKFNHALEESIGLRSRDIEGKTPDELFPARVALTLLENYRTCISTNGSLRYEELLNLNGRECWWETTLSPLYNEASEITGIVGISSDISERKAEELLSAKAFSDLKKLNDNVSLFSSMTAHDVRGPLNKIKMLTEATLEEFKDLGDEKREMIELTHNVALQALDYVEIVLGYAKSLKAPENKPADFDLAHICRDVAALIDPEAKLAISSPNVTVRCDGVVLQMIIRNLAENASRYAERQIVIDAEVEPETPEVLRFTVANDGEGFALGAEGFAERIAARSVDDGNRGFGLAAVAHLVQARGGKVWLSEHPFESGTAISFTLPALIVANSGDLSGPFRSAPSGLTDVGMDEFGKVA